MKKVILFTLLLIGTNSLIAQYPTVNTQRPRVWLEPSRIATLKNLITIPGKAKDTYDDFTDTYYDWWIQSSELYIDGTDSTEWTWQWNNGRAIDEALFTLLIYKLTDEPIALKRLRFIARKHVECVDTVDFEPMLRYQREALLRNLSDMNIVLDQLYDELPLDLRNDLAQSSYTVTEEFLNRYVFSSWGESYVSGHNVDNMAYHMQNILTLYNAEGLSASQKDNINTWFETLYDKIIDKFNPCWSYYFDDDGAWNRGAGYSSYGLVALYGLFEDLRIGTSKNLFHEFSWVSESINQYLYFTQPNHKTIHFGDSQAEIYSSIVMNLHAREFNDPRSIWLSQFYADGSYGNWTMAKFRTFLYRDYSIEPITLPEIPLNWQADKVGIAVSRSSWEDNATMVYFSNSTHKRAAHEHFDNNSFTIFKNAPLLLDAGYYDDMSSSHDLNYHKKTIAHNTICVYDSDEVFLNHQGELLSNDGGQQAPDILSNYEEIFLPENHKGDWIKYASGENYSYSIADAQLAYNPTKLDLFRRRFLYIKPEKVIVLDHVHLLDIDTKQRDIKWVAHFANKPELDGTIINTQVPNHIETYNGKEYTAINGDGSIAIKTLLPSNTNTKLIGGDGYEYWVENQNYPIIEDLGDSNTMGDWRIEVRPNTLTDTVIYLHTIDIGNATDVAIASGIAFQNQFSIGTDWNDTLYYFSADATINKTYHVFYEVEGNREVGIFATDLTNGLYDILVNDVNKITIATDTNGILQSSVVLNSGNNKVEIAAHILNVNEVLNNKLKVYPNPAKDKIIIEDSFNNTSFEIKIFNANGKLIFYDNDKTSINISNFNAGHYFIQVKQGQDLYSTVFVKQR